MTSRRPHGFALLQLALTLAAALSLACARGQGAADDGARSDSTVAASPHAATARPVLRVCADPNNLPFSNERREGFENRLAELLGEELGMEVRYTWWAQRRGFVRNTLGAGACDVIPGIVASSERVLTTRPYYRSTYVFVTRRDAPPALRHLASLDDPQLRRLRIGVHLVGDDYTNTPPAHALANRGIVRNVKAYSLYGDYAKPDPPLELVNAVTRGDVDVAIVWGPFAGWVAARGAPIALRPVTPQIDLPFLPFVYDIAMGVRRGDDSLRARLDGALARRHADVTALLARYGVPVVGADQGPTRAPAVAGR